MNPVEIQARLLHQDKIWIDIEGRERRLEDMDVHHRANITALLHRRAITLQHLCYVDAPLLLVEDPSDGVFAAQQVAERDYARDPNEWLDSTPLLRRLAEMDSRGFVARVGTKVRAKAYRMTH